MEPPVNVERPGFEAPTVSAERALEAVLLREHALRRLLDERLIGPRERGLRVVEGPGHLDVRPRDHGFIGHALSDRGVRDRPIAGHGPPVGDYETPKPMPPAERGALKTFPSRCAFCRRLDAVHPCCTTP